MTDQVAAFWAGRWKQLLGPARPTANCALPGWAATWAAGKTSASTSPVPTPSSPGSSRTPPGQILTSLPAVAIVRACQFSAHTLPIERWPTPEQLYSATGLAPAIYQSSTIVRRGAISRRGLAEHRNALMGIAWGLSQNSPAFQLCDRELRARGFRPIQARVAIARHACRLCWRLLQTQQPYDEQRYAHARRRGR